MHTFLSSTQKTLIATSIAVVCLIVTSAAKAQELSANQVNEILADNQRVLIIDRLATSQRKSLLSYIRNSLNSNGSIPILRVLCQIDPWALNDDVQASAFQAEIYSSLKTTVKPWSYDFEVADCAAANREGSYFSKIPEQKRTMRDAFIQLKGKEWIEKSAPNAADVIRAVDAPLLRATRGSNRRSFFPLLNVQHMSEILSAQAVLSANSAPEQSKQYFEDAAKLFEDWESGSPAHYRTARNGFRYENDLKFYRLFYRAMSGDEEARDELADISQWPRLLSHTDTTAIMSSRTIQRIRDENPDYVDPIYFGRLLPGSAKTQKEEKDRWWRTYYPTQEVVRHISFCLDKYWNYEYAERIFSVDDCIAIFDPNDWRVELASFKGHEAQRQRALDERTRLLSNVFANGRNSELEKFRSDFGVYFERGRWWIRTEQKYTRKEIALFRDGLADVRGNPQYIFFRQIVY